MVNRNRKSSVCFYTELFTHAAFPIDWLIDLTEQNNSCFYLIYWSVAPLYVLIISNNVLSLSKEVISWCWGFLKQPFFIATACGGGGGARSGEFWLKILALCV